MSLFAANSLRRSPRWLWFALELALWSVLILATRCANYENVFIGGRVYFVDADCYSRMTRARMVVEHPGRVVRHQEFENFPAGTNAHTTAPLDDLVAGLTMTLRPFARQPLDLAGAWISPLLALATGSFLCWWSRRMRLRERWVGLLLFALSPILAHGTALGRPDHQALLILLVVLALAAEVSLGEKPSRGWALLGGLSWGLALWVSLYEPLLLLVALAAMQRGRMFEPARRIRWLATGAVLLLAALVEQRVWEFPAAALHDSYLNWSATIGELSRVRLTSPLWWEWLGGFFLLAPVLAFVALRRRAIAPELVALLALTFALTWWQARWAYFLAAVLCVALPFLLTAVRRRWVATLLAAVALLPCFWAWNDRTPPNDNAATRREPVEWRQAAEALPHTGEQAFLAPWWLAPSAAYWSGQPSVAGSSHESLPGIVASARFYLATDPGEARKILETHRVRWVLSYDADRVTANSAAILGVQSPTDPLCRTLDRTPSRAPEFLQLAGQNGTAKLYQVRDLR